MMPPSSIHELASAMNDSGWESEFLQQLAANYRHLYACALTVVGQRDDAGDVIQEACVTLWEKYRDGEFEQVLNFRKWACGIVFNLARQHVRKRRRHLHAGLSDHVLGQIIQARSAGSELLELRREILRECLGKLSLEDRKFLVERYQAETSLAETARKQGRSLSAVYSKLKRLRHLLTDCMRRRLGTGEDW